MAYTTEGTQAGVGASGGSAGRSRPADGATAGAAAAGVWSAAGEDYERISETLADAIEHCVGRLRPRAGERVLDLATGTGWAARRIAARGARVVAVDFAAPLVEAGARIAQGAGLDIDFRVGDAERLDFDDASFDAVVSTFGVMFVRDPGRAAGELARVCRPGGRIALTTWPADGAVAALFGVIRPYLPAPNVPPPSPFAWGHRERVAELLGDDFDLRFETGTTLLREADSPAAWSLFESCYGPTRTLAATLPPDRRAALRQDFIDFHERFRTELGIAVPRDYLLAVGVRR